MTSVATSLAFIEGVILDLDGTVYVGGKPLPGAVEFFNFAHSSGLGVVALTNNSSHRAAELSAKLKKWGIELPPENIVTSAWATAQYLTQFNKPNVYVVGSVALRQELKEVANFGPRPEFVVAGFTRDLEYWELRQAVGHLLDGAELIGTNPDRLLPTAEGLIPESGPLIRYLEHASAKTATIIGKPNPLMVKLALEKMGKPKTRVLMVGDTWETDIAAAMAAGLPSVWVRSGNGGDDDTNQYNVLRANSLGDLIALLG